MVLSVRASDDGEVTNPSSARNVAAVVLVLAVPVAVASLVGDLSETNDPRPDYVIRPPEIPIALGLTLAALSVLLVIVSTAVIVSSWRWERPQPGWLSVLLPVLAVGAIVGLAWRVLTAAVIGANIGAGLMVLLGTPVVVALIVFAGISAWRRR